MMRIYRATQRDQKKHKGDWVQNISEFTGAERRPAKILPMHDWGEQAYVEMRLYGKAHFKIYQTCSTFKVSSILICIKNQK